MKAEEESRALAAARARTGAERAEIRTRLQALWSSRARLQARRGARIAAALGAAVIVAYGVYLAIPARQAVTSAAMPAGEGATLKLDYELRMEPAR